MTDFLTAVKTVSLRPRIDTEEDAPIVERRQLGSTVKKHGPIATAEDVLQTLRSQPDREELHNALKWLRKSSSPGNGFDIRLPGPSQAKIINGLVSATLPDYWTTLDNSDRSTALYCLRSVAGIAAVIARLNHLANDASASKKGTQKDAANHAEPATLITILESLLEGDGFVRVIWLDCVSKIENSVQAKLLWKEFVNALASGKIIATVARVQDVTRREVAGKQDSWLSVGRQYASWLGSNVAELIASCDQNDHKSWTAAAQLFGRATTIGYPDQIFAAMYRKLLIVVPSKAMYLHSLLAHLPSNEQKGFIEHSLRFLTREYSLDGPIGNAELGIPPASAVVAALIGESEVLHDKLSEWLSDPALNAIEPLASRRMVFAALSSDKQRVHELTKSVLSQFGEVLFIKHSPIAHQEACAQVLLLAAGGLKRNQPQALQFLAKSSSHLQGTSNRLSSSSPKARFLGMCAATAMSDLVDKAGQKMKFDMEELNTPEAQALIGLVHVNDKVGSMDEVAERAAGSTQMERRKKTNTQSSSKTNEPGKSSRPLGKGTISPASMSASRVVEVLSDSEDDLVPYAKPDSDPEDEEDDPTLINRNKARPPVYIRDLIAGLQDTETFDRHTLALTHAGALIRRKANFGKEVSDHAEELAIILSGLNDAFDTPDFLELRLQALIAVLISDPSRMAPWFARQVFDGDYSLSQRGTLLSVLGLGARELAGFKDEDKLNPPVTASESFPSKKLPPRLHNIYSTADQSSIGALADRLEHTMVQPLATQAADDLSGPKALKVRTFSSRMQIEAKRKKAIPNALAKVVAESFFFLLTGRWWQTVQAYGRRGRDNNVHMQPFLLSTYLKTLAILLHASGPSTLSLPQMTNEFWDLLLSVRARATEDVAVLESVLFGLLSLLEVNDDQGRLAEEHGKRLLETQEWADMIFERASGGDEEGERVRMLAASVLVKTREVVEKYQRMLMGDMVHR